MIVNDEFQKQCEAEAFLLNLHAHLKNTYVSEKLNYHHMNQPLDQN